MKNHEVCSLTWTVSVSRKHSESESESESYVTTDGQSASLSWNKALIWGLRPDFYYCQSVAGLQTWVALSDDRTSLSFTVLLVLDSAVIFGSESRGTRDHILLSQVRDFHFSRLLRFAGLRWRYSTPLLHSLCLITFRRPRTEHLIPGFSSSYPLQLFAFVRVVPETCMNCYLAKWVVQYLAPLFRLLGGVYRRTPGSDSTIAAFRRHVTISCGLNPRYLWHMSPSYTCCKKKVRWDSAGNKKTICLQTHETLDGGELRLTDDSDMFFQLLGHWLGQIINSQ
jgi:hypothetical protein